MLDLHRNWFKGIENKTADIFAVLPFTPNQYTSFSIIVALAMLCLIIIGHYIGALALFLLSAGLDFVDGAVARRKGLSTNKGAYWDTIADRYVEAIFLLGVMFAGLPDFYMPACVWIFLVLVGSLMTTYAKAAAKEKGLSDMELRGGVMSRGERFISYGAILVFLVCGYSQWAAIIVAVLALLSNLTAIQRISMAWSKK